MDLKKAAAINAAGKYSTVIIQLIVTAILSRLLSPEDYGVVAVVTVFSTFFAALSSMGFGTAIIQNKTLTKTDIDNIFSFTVYIGAGLSVIFALLSFVIAWLYNDSLYIPVSMLLSISLFFGTLNMVPGGVLDRDKKFVLIAVRTVVVYTASAGIAIVLAFFGFRYYALVIQTILSSFFTFIWNYLSVSPKFHAKADMRSIRKIANYSGYQFAFNFVNYFAGNLDNLLTGKFFGSSDLGYYNKAYTLTLYPVNNLTGVISPVLHPVLSDLQSDRKALYQKYLKIVKLLALIGCYAEAVCILAGREMVFMMFGSQWEKSVICFRMLGLCIVFRMINSSSGAVFQSLGNTKLLFRNGLLNTMISVTAILIGIFVFGDIQGLSACVAFAYIFHYITASAMLIKGGFSFSLMQYYRDIINEVIIFFVMVMSALLLTHFDLLTLTENNLIGLMIKGGVMTVLFAVLLIATKEYAVFTSLFRKSSQ